MKMQEIGKVKWFNEDKGYGFITRDKGPDAFFHFTDIMGEGYRSLKEGQEVQFKLVMSPRGPHAQDVEKI